MAIDASIPLSVKPIQIDNPLDNYGKALGLRSLLLQNQAHQQSADDNQRLRELFSGGTPPTTAQVYAASPGAGAAYQKSNLELQKTQSELAQHDHASIKAFAEESMQELKSMAPERWQQYRQLQQGRAAALQTPQLRDLAMQHAAQIPEQYDPKWIQAALAKTEGFATPDYKPVAAGGKTVFAQTNPNAPGFSAEPIQHTPTDRDLRLGINEPFSPGPDGPVANKDVQDFQLKKATAGATVINARDIYDPERGVSVNPEKATARPVTLPGGAVVAPKVHGQTARSEQLYKDYANNPQVKEANDLEVKMKPLATYRVFE